MANLAQYREQAINRAARWAIRYGVLPPEFRAAVSDVRVEECSACRLLISGMNRLVLTKFQPCERGRSTTGDIIDPATVDPWAQSPEELQQQTRQVVGCPPCSGGGEVTCPACGGSTWVLCGACGGSGKQVSASTKRVRLINCQGCRGAGRVRCGCRKGFVLCGACAGSGRLLRWLEVVESPFTRIIVFPDNPLGRALEQEGLHRSFDEPVNLSGYQLRERWQGASLKELEPELRESILRLHVPLPLDPTRDQVRRVEAQSFRGPTAQVEYSLLHSPGTVEIAGDKQAIIAKGTRSEPLARRAAFLGLSALLFLVMGIVVYALHAGRHAFYASGVQARTLGWLALVGAVAVLPLVAALSLPKPLSRRLGLGLSAVPLVLVLALQIGLGATGDPSVSRARDHHRSGRTEQALREVKACIDLGIDGAAARQLQDRIALDRVLNQSTAQQAARATSGARWYHPQFRREAEARVAELVQGELMGHLKADRLDEAQTVLELVPASEGANPILEHLRRALAARRELSGEGAAQARLDDCKRRVASVSEQGARDIKDKKVLETLAGKIAELEARCASWNGKASSRPDFDGALKEAKLTAELNRIYPYKRKQVREAFEKREQEERETARREQEAARKACQQQVSSIGERARSSLGDRRLLAAVGTYLEAVHLRCGEPEAKARGPLGLEIVLKEVGVALAIKGARSVPRQEPRGGGPAGVLGSLVVIFIGLLAGGGMLIFFMRRGRPAPAGPTPARSPPSGEAETARAALALMDAPAAVAVPAPTVSSGAVPVTPAVQRAPVSRVSSARHQAASTAPSPSSTAAQPWSSSESARFQSALALAESKPVAVATAPRMPSGAVTVIPTVQNAPVSSARMAGADWIPAGRAVEVSGYTIPGGMLYVGNRLTAISGGDVEPALIVPGAKVVRSRPDRAGVSMTYWPSYSQIDGEARAAYLEWLSSGRCAPNVYIGYVFLFFYGLERRVLHDAPRDDAAKAEVPIIRQEVGRLLNLYGDSHSFRRYATSFLDICQLIEGWSESEALAAPERPVRGFEIPLQYRVALGHLANHGQPVPADWALAWAWSHPEVYFRTPAERCRAEFDELFRLRYQKQFGAGLVIRPTKARVSVDYQPASASFGGTYSIPLGLLPDVSRAPGPVGKLRELVNSCTEDLDAYSRWLGRNQGNPYAVAGVSLLPRELLEHHATKEIAELRDWATDLVSQGGYAKVPGAALIGRWQGESARKLTKADCVALAQLLEKLGVGMEPDPRFGSATLAGTDTAVLFRWPLGAPVAPSREYASTTVLMHLGVAIAAADGVSPEEEDLLERQAQGAASIDAFEKVRLLGHLKWLIANPPSLTGLKRRVDQIDATGRRAVAELLVAVAGADGKISKPEVAALTKAYGLLGLDQAAVFADIHALTASVPAVAPTTPALEPVTLRPATPSKTGLRVPPRMEQVPRQTSGEYVLDMAKVEAKIAESARVCSLLSDIFVEEAESAPRPAVTKTPDKHLLAGLDATHTALLAEVLERSSWGRAEWDELCSRHQVLPDGALEAINEAAFDAHEEPLLEGDDPMELNETVAKELKP